MRHPDAEDISACVDYHLERLDTEQRALYESQRGIIEMHIRNCRQCRKAVTALVSGIAKTTIESILHKPYNIPQEFTRAALTAPQRAYPSR